MTTAEDIVALETAALARWCDGDPSGFLDLSADDVVYFDPFHSRRIDGLGALRVLYESLRGRIKAAGFRLENPFVQHVGDAAVLTYNFTSWDGAGGQQYWNCTEVFRREAAGWRIIQTHWSFAVAPDASMRGG